jgi:hypothetical protein
VTLTALEDSIEWPEQLRAPDALQVRRGSRGQIYQMAGQNLQPRSTFLYRVKSSSLGEHTIPPFRVKVYGQEVEVPAASLSVVQELPAGALTMQELFIELPETNLFIGQAVRANIILCSTVAGVIQGFGQVQIMGDGFLIEQTGVQQRIEPRRKGTTNLVAMVYETTVTPISAGRLGLRAKAFLVGNRLPPPPVPTNAPPALVMPLYTLVDSEPVEIQVNTLPGGPLPGFVGAIGPLTLDRPVLETNSVRVGDPVRLLVRVRGPGNLPRLVPPPPPAVREWRIFPGKADFASPQQPGAMTFVYLLVPISDRVEFTPSIPYSYFDPRLKRYVDLTIPRVKVSVLPGGPSPTELQELLASMPAEPVGDEPPPRLRGLLEAPGVAAVGLVPLQERPWFALVQLGPAFLFLGVWLWDKRRHYLEMHPGILVRRRARRALKSFRRKMHRAAKNADAVAYAAAAVDAMRAGSAPHFPAEPRALVGTDVLWLLGNGDGHDANTAAVRRLFDIADAGRFSTERPDPRELLALQPNVEAVITKLAARL